MLKRLPLTLAVLLALLVALCACDYQNLPGSDTPTAVAVLPATATTAPDTATPQPPTPTQEQPTATATEVPTLIPTVEESTPTTEPTEEPATPTQEALPTDTPGEEVATVTPAPRLTRTPTPTPDGSQPPTVAVKTNTVVAEEPPTGGWSQVVRGPVGNKRVAITFDAGASGETCPRVLSTFRERGLNITMFFTGKFAEQYPDCVKQAVTDGNEIANHTYSHLDSRDLTDEQLAGELARTEGIIQGLTGVSSKPYWRPPFGAYNNHVLNVAVSQGYRSIYWTLDSLDSVGQPKTPDFIFNRVTNTPGFKLDGAIILQHFGSEASAEALPRELDKLKEMGYQVVTISRLLSP